MTSVLIEYYILRPEWANRVTSILIEHSTLRHEWGNVTNRVTFVLIEHSSLHPLGVRPCPLLIFRVCRAFVNSRVCVSFGVESGVESGVDISNFYIDPFILILIKIWISAFCDGVL